MCQETISAERAAREIPPFYVRQRTDCRRVRAHAGSIRAGRKGEQTMKRSTHRSRKSAELPIAWREAEYAALRNNAADSYDDRISENYFDAEDARAEVDSIVHRIIHDSN